MYFDLAVRVSNSPDEAFLGDPSSKFRKTPLGVAEANSVLDEELVPIKLIYPDREGEMYSVRAGPAHKWHYLNKQTPEEALLTECFDSKTEVVGQG